MVVHLSIRGTAARRLAPIAVGAAVVLGCGLGVAPAGAAPHPREADAPVVVDPTQQWVGAVYLDVALRPADPTGLADWTAVVQAGHPRRALADAILGSAEGTHTLIELTYRELLERETGMNETGWFLAYYYGGMTRQQLRAGLSGSPEYYQAAGGTDAAWIGALYQAALGRTASASDVAAWASALARGASTYEVALGIWTSAEGLGVTVDGLYQDMLGRPADPAGRAAWVAAMQAGAREESVVSAFTASEEYWERATAR